jgi:hypothetical protein
MLLLAVACLIFVSCGNRAEKPAVVEEPVCEFKLMLDKWDAFADLEEEGQIALVAEMKAFFDAKCEEHCKEAKEECEEAKEVCPEKEAKCAEFKAQWEAFETLTLEEQKAIIDQIIEHKSKCCKEKEEGCCKKDKKETCEKE